ncbi:hypothetical protein B0H12DRAFT_1244470 [Mycena haematopus]|nr:hypothetical protein B0H12DRAFT_1244470 [Mycena haematopus]
MPPRSTQTKASRKRKVKVTFGVNSSRKRRASPAAKDSAGTSSLKRPRMNGAPETTTTGTTDTGGPSSAADTSGSAAGAGSTGTDTNEEVPEASFVKKKRVRNRWGISPKKVPIEAKVTQRAFQCFIRGLCGLLTQTDVLPTAIEAQKHYDKRFDDIYDYREQMRTLIDQSRTAVSTATVLASKLVRDAKRVSGPIANDIARIPETHLATVFTMVQKAGLQGFCPDLEGPVQSRYNQLHRHLAVSGFQFLSASFALCALEVNLKVAENTELLCDMYDNYIYGTLAQKTKMERRHPGSLAQSVKNGVEYKARTRLRDVRFKTASQLGLRKPVLRMLYVDKAHSDDEHKDGERYVCDKPGRNPILARAPKPRIRADPLIPASPIGLILPPDVPIDFFTPEFFNALTVKERARYVNTGVAFPLEEFAFDEARNDWKTMGKKEFMEMYGNDILDEYEIPSIEEINALPKSDAKDDEDQEEIDLGDTDDEDDKDDQMEVEDSLTA